jgi:ribosomal protein L3
MTFGILGKKLGMTQVYGEDGSVIPVTLIQAGPCPILQKKEKARDGYNAIQLGFESKPERTANKPELGPTSGRRRRRRCDSCARCASAIRINMKSDK